MLSGDPVPPRSVVSRDGTRPVRARQRDVALLPSILLVVGSKFVLSHLAQGVIERRADGKFDQDQSRLKYLAHLRSPERRSARSEAAAKHAEAKNQLLHIRIEEKQRKLVRREDVDALIGQIAGVTPTALSSLPARCAPRGDLATPRCIERVVFEVRTEMAKVCQQMADKHGEPPLDDDP
jgi:hypothetical protein